MKQVSIRLRDEQTEWLEEWSGDSSMSEAVRAVVDRQRAAVEKTSTDPDDRPSDENLARAYEALAEWSEDGKVMPMDVAAGQVAAATGISSDQAKRFVLRRLYREGFVLWRNSPIDGFGVEVKPRGLPPEKWEKMAVEQ